MLLTLNFKALFKNSNMTAKNPFTMPPVNRYTLFIFMLAGAVIGLGIITLFVFTVDHPDPAWPAYWRLRPLIITPLAAAAGAAAVYLFNLVMPKTGWLKMVTIILSVIGFLISLWLGIVVGLDGTLWN